MATPGPISSPLVSIRWPCANQAPMPHPKVTRALPQNNTAGTVKGESPGIWQNLSRTQFDQLFAPRTRRRLTRSLALARDAKKLPGARGRAMLGHVQWAYTRGRCPLPGDSGGSNGALLHGRTLRSPRDRAARESRSHRRGLRRRGRARVRVRVRVVRPDLEHVSTRGVRRRVRRGVQQEARRRGTGCARERLRTEQHHRRRRRLRHAEHGWRDRRRARQRFVLVHARSRQPVQRYRQLRVLDPGRRRRHRLRNRDDQRSRRRQRRQLHRGRESPADRRGSGRHGQRRRRRPLEHRDRLRERAARHGERRRLRRVRLHPAPELHRRRQLHVHRVGLRRRQRVHRDGHAARRCADSPTASASPASGEAEGLLDGRRDRTVYAFGQVRYVRQRARRSASRTSSRHRPVSATGS